MALFPDQKAKQTVFLLQSVLTVGQQVLILFILSGVGFALGKAKMVGEAFSRGCSQLIMYVVSPCMMVVAFQRSFEKEGFHNFCMALLLAVLIHLLGIAMAQLFFRHDGPPSLFNRQRRLPLFAMLRLHCFQTQPR